MNEPLKIESREHLHSLLMRVVQKLTTDIVDVIANADFSALVERPDSRADAPACDTSKLYVASVDLCEQLRAELQEARAQLDTLKAIINDDGSLTEWQEFVDICVDMNAAYNNSRKEQRELEEAKYAWETAKQALTSGEAEITELRHQVERLRTALWPFSIQPHAEWCVWVRESSDVWEALPATCNCGRYEAWRVLGGRDYREGHSEEGEKP